jgi:hypothetical protein
MLTFCRAFLVETSSRAPGLGLEPVNSAVVCHPAVDGCAVKISGIGHHSVVGKRAGAAQL